MAATDLATILAAFDTVLGSLGLEPSQQPFTHDRQPNVSITNRYCLDDGGQLSRRSMTNGHEVRVDRIRILVAKPLAFAGPAQFKAMVALGDTIYRALSADGRAQGWNIEQAGHRVTQTKNTDLLIGSFDFTADYDFSTED